MNNFGIIMMWVEVDLILEIKKNRKNQKRVKKIRNIKKVKENIVHLNLSHLVVCKLYLKIGVEVDKENVMNRYKQRQAIK